MRAYIIFLSIIGILISFADLFSNLFHKKLCTASGCELVSDFSRFGSWAMLTLGILFFLTLIVLTLLKKDKFLSLLIVSAFSIEGYLQGFQIFIISKVCYVCLSIFIVIFLLSFYVFKQDKKLFGVGALSFLGIIFAMFLISVKVPIVKDENTLFYLPGCPHCEHTISFLNKEGISYEKLNANDYKAFLLSLRIEEVPVMLTKTDTGYYILVGSSNIENYFSKNVQKNKSSDSSIFNVVNPFENNNGCSLEEPQNCLQNK